MNNKLFVGNLPYSATEEELKEAFSQAGTVVSVKIIMDRDTGRSKGFGFVEMTSDAEANVALEKLNNADYAGRAITVSIARPPEPRTGGFGGGDRGGRGGFGGGR
ncbi:MAG: RNA-binding protein [Cryobacterium sp.]|nr:RNA-binding protein [Oligoflexia bacterium]